MTIPDARSHAPEIEELLAVISETQLLHTEMLKQQNATLDKHSATQARQTLSLDLHSVALRQLTDTLEGNSGLLEQHSKALAHQTVLLNKLGRDLVQVHGLLIRQRNHWDKDSDILAIVSHDMDEVKTSLAQIVDVLERLPAPPPSAPADLIDEPAAGMVVGSTCS